MERAKGVILPMFLFLSFQVPALPKLLGSEGSRLPSEDSLIFSGAALEAQAQYCEAMEDSFQRHLDALNAVYEQVILENAELRKQLGKAPQEDPLRQLSQTGSMPPLPALPPIATISTLNLQHDAVNVVQLPGALESEKLSPRFRERANEKEADKDHEDLNGCHSNMIPSLSESLPSPAPPSSNPPPMTDSKSVRSKPSQRRSSFLRNSLKTSDSEEESEDDVTLLHTWHT